jgi:hypothetical protein
MEDYYEFSPSELDTQEQPNRIEIEDKDKEKKKIGVSMFYNRIIS